MDYMHLLVGRPTQKSKKLEVCYTLDDVAYVRPKRLKEDAKVDFIDWSDTVLGRLQAAYDRIPLKDDRDSVLVDYRKLVGCLKDAFITLTDGFYESSELFEETCSDSDLRCVFLAALEVFGLSNVLKLKTNDVWNLLEDLDVSVHKIPDKAVFNRLQERYLEKGFSVFELLEAVKSSVRDVDSVLSEIMPFERTTSMIDKSLVSLKTATSECASDAIKISEGFESDVADLDEAIMSTSEEHQSNSLYYSEALLSEIAVDDFVKPMIDGEPVIGYVKQSVSDLVDSDVSGIYVAGDTKPLVTWSADNKEFREMPLREQLEEYAEEKSVPLFNLESKEDKFYLGPCSETAPDVPMIDNKISKKNTFYVEPLLQVVSEDDVPELDTTIAKKDTFHDDSQKSPIDYWHGQPLIVTDKKPGFYTTGLEIVLDRLPPKDVLKNVYVDYGSLRSAVQLCLLQDVFDVRVMIDELLRVFDAVGCGDYANDGVLRGEKIKFLRSGLIRCLLEIKSGVVSPLWDNQTDDQFGFDVKTVQQVLINLIKIYGRNEGVIESWFTVSYDIKRLVKQALDYVSNDAMFVKIPVSLKHTEFSDWLSPNECDALSQLLFFDAKKTDWYRSKAIEKDLMEQYKACSLLPLDFLKDDTVTNPSRYRKNNIEAWDFTIQSLLPHPLATVAEYVIRYPYKGGREDLEKAMAWSKKAESSLPYLKATLGYGDSIVDDLPKVTKEQFPDCSEGQRDVLRAVQKATLALRGSLGYGEPEDALRDVTDKVMKLLDEM